MIFDSETVLQEAYDSVSYAQLRSETSWFQSKQSLGKPFAIPMVDRYIVFVSDRQQAEQLEHESPYNLSMEEALHEVRPLSRLQLAEAIY